MEEHISTEARRLARRTVDELALAEGPPGGGTWFRHPGSLAGGTSYPPLAGVQAAKHLATVMHQLVIEHALQARGAGEGWDEIAVALELTAVGDRPDALAAYLTVLGVRADDPWWSPARGVEWRCRSCAQVIRDFGPECGGPDDSEAGHAPSCSRHNADLSAWMEMWT